ncbi:Formate/nitrite transporter [Methylocapsa palsarum]|uniref:Formate/nitrite transporter n=1 Tax=Methylocapsa palsarum TaxID=1612308 RepID=A0A1I4CUR0_9HYPH|nr:Formate/nitrite transporter [Methylocapsa palsarum]
MLANILATGAIAWVLATASPFEPNQQHALAEISVRIFHGGFGPTFVRAIFAGWLIGLMVWILPAVGSARPLIIIAITYVVAIGRFSHLIAGSVDAFYAVAIGEASWFDYAYRFFLPTLLGNVVGGVALVAGLNYGQVAPQLNPNGSKSSQSRPSPN